MAIGLALSGGGLRATLFHLGVVRALRDAGVLKEVAHICSVSGGSILAAHLVLHWEDYLGEGFEARAQEILAFCSFDVRNHIFRRYPSLIARWCASKAIPFHLLASKGPTDLLQEYYGKLYGEATLEQLRAAPGQSRPDLHILTTNLTTATLCSFGNDGFLSEAAAATGRRPRARVHIKAATPTLCFAVAASSAFPGMFSPIRLTARALGKFDAELDPAEQFVTDGGVYDNLGVRKFMSAPQDLDRLERVFVSNAGMELKTGGGREHVGLVRTALRASDILSHRVHQLETAAMERLSSEAPSGKFVPINIRDVVPRSEDPHALHENTQEWLRWVRTDLDRFSAFESHCLIRHGWSQARRALRNSGAGNPAIAPWEAVPSDSMPRTPAKEVAELSKSVGRRARLFSAKDPVSWLHAAILVVLAGLFMFGVRSWEHARRPLMIEAAEGRMRAKARKHQHQLAVKLSYRRMPDNLAYFYESASSPKKTPSSYVTLSTLNSLLLEDAYRDRQLIASHVAVLKNAFDNPKDFDRQAKAWKFPLAEFAVMSTPALRVEASLWCMSLLSRFLQTRDQPKERIDEFMGQLNTVCEGLRNFQGENGAWRLISDQEDRAANHPYAAAFALTALMEYWKAAGVQEVPTYDPGLLAATRVRLVRDWQPGGWTVKGMDGQIGIPRGLTMLAYSALLRFDEAHSKIAALAPELREDIRSQVERPSGAPGVNFREMSHIPIRPAAGGGEAAVGLEYQWLPWTIDCAHEWLRWLRRQEPPDDREILVTLAALEGLVSKPLDDFMNEVDAKTTEDLAELYLALGNLLREGP